MTGQAIQNIEKLKQLSRNGLTCAEAAQQLDICIPYIKRLAKHALIVFATKPDHRVQLLQDLANKGILREEAARQLGVSYLTIRLLAKKHAINFVHGNKKTSPTVRTRQMAALYQSGKTLQEIGTQYGITRERVRQLITKFHGLKGSDGGQYKCSLEKRAKFEAKRNARSLKVNGCNWDQYIALRAMRKPLDAFRSQKGNAGTRGIDWELSLWEWWSIWQQSGKWKQRGRGQGYVMCRNGDVGPYAIDNVFIALARENSSDQKRKISGLPMGVTERNGRFFAKRHINGVVYELGSHPTPELAHAAYLACGEKDAA